LADVLLQELDQRVLLTEPADVIVDALRRRASPGTLLTC